MGVKFAPWQSGGRIGHFTISPEARSQTHPELSRIGSCWFFESGTENLLRNKSNPIGVGLSSLTQFL